MISSSSVIEKDQLVDSFYSVVSRLAARLRNGLVGARPPESPSVDARATASPDPLQAAGSACSLFGKTAARARRKVLLIDDDPFVVGLYETLFRGAGYEVRQAEDGEAGLAAVHEQRPDAVMLDLSMPRVNGLQWLDTIRKEPAFRQLPVIVFTAGDIAWQVSAARNSDATVILSKRGTRPERVIDAVGSAIETGSWVIGLKLLHD